MGEQLITGTPSSWRAPFTRAEILFNQGASNAAAGPRSAIYFGPKTAAGTYTVNTVYRVNTEGDVATGAGDGSPLHRMVRAHLLANQQGKVYVVAYAETSGGSPAAATGTITAGGTPTATGNVYFTVCGEEMSASFNTASTPTTIGDAIASGINGKTWLPCTAANVAGTVTLTAKLKGASQGDATIGVIRIRASVDAGKGVTCVAGQAALGIAPGVAGADGSTTESANLTTALAVINAVRHYYIGVSVNVATPLGVVKTHVATKSLPNPGLRSVAFSGYTHTLAACQTLATGLNYERQHVVWQKNSEHDSAELVGFTIGAVQLEESTNPAKNFDFYNRAGVWHVKRAYAESDWPTGDDENDAVTDGIWAIRSTVTGSQMVMAVNTKSKDAAGSNDDFRSTERHRVSVMDDFTDTVLRRHATTFEGFKLKDDERLADGTVNTNQKIGARVLTPSRFKSWFLNIVSEYIYPLELFQRPDEWIRATRVNIDPNNASRIECGTSGRTIDLHHQTTFRLSEASPG